jgi:hypothetical protein
MFLFMSGNKATGFKDLDYAWKNAEFCKIECGYHLSNIYIKYEGTPLLAYEYIKELHERYPANLYYASRYAEVLLAKEDYKGAEKIAHSLYKSSNTYFTAVACVIYGLIYENFFKVPSTSSTFYLKSIQLFKKAENPGCDFLSFAYAGLGRYYDTSGNKIKATEYYEKCREIAAYKTIQKETEEYFRKK